MTRGRLFALTVVWLSGIFVVAAMTTRWFFFDYFHVPSDSMYPTVPGSSFIIVDRRGFGNIGPFRLLKREPTATVSRGDIIVFLLSDSSTAFVKRVIGLPGDHVVLQGRQLAVNGTLIPVVAGARTGMYQHATETVAGRPITIAWLPERPSRDFDGVVPAGHYFVLGDSRDNAQDSRFEKVGFVPKQRIIGRVVRVITPSRFGPES